MNQKINFWTVMIMATSAFAFTDVHAFRMIYTTTEGRTSNGSTVPCDYTGGFVHPAQPTFWWRLNTTNQGGNAGVATALQNAMASWNVVLPGQYTLTYSGTTTQGFATDGSNTVLWANDNGCTGGCLAITALVLTAGKVIVETDVSFNAAATWSIGGGGTDIQAVAAHEFGHTLGIHHTELKVKHNRPTMYSQYFGTDGRSLEADDKSALVCSHNRYPVP